MSDEFKQSDIEVLSTDSLINLPVKEGVKAVKDLVRAGVVDNAYIAVSFKKISDIYDEVRKDKDIKEILENSLRPYAEDKANPVLLGYILSERATRTWYDFSECGHPVYDELCKLEEQIKEMKKQLEEQLKALIPKTTQYSFGIPNTNQSINIESIPVLNWEPSGEVAELKAPLKRQTTGIVFTKQK